MLCHCENVKRKASFHYFSDVKDHIVLRLTSNQSYLVYTLVLGRFPKNPSAKFYNLFLETFLSKKPFNKDGRHARKKIDNFCAKVVIFPAV